MNKKHSKILKKDFLESKFNLSSIIIELKLFYYLFQRPLCNIKLKKQIYLDNNFFLRKTNLFLRNEGGMFKTHVYGICDKINKLKNSVILVPGCGYGHNLFQLAAFKPKKIIAFDIYEYPEEWEFVKENIRNFFGVNIEFFQGSFNSILKKREKYFDWIISDAVLEHVQDMECFVKQSRILLKKDGMFYASFGPIWYGPKGDHLDWGSNEKMFNHLVLNQKEYKKRLENKFRPTFSNDSCEGVFMFENNLFSYLKSREYINFFENNGFKIEKLFAKISIRALHFLKRSKGFMKLLNKKNIPKFDRFCSGFYLWAKPYK